MRNLITLALLLAASGAQAQKSADDCRAEVGDRGRQTQRFVVDCLLGQPVPEPEQQLPRRNPQNAAVLAFARKYAGKYRAELPATGLTAGSAVTVRVRLDAYDAGRYDGNAGVFQITPYRLPDLEFMRACRGAGSFAGQNAFGARAVVERRVCDVAVVDEPARSIRLSGKFELSPAEYRKAEQRGFEFHIDFKLATDSSGHAAWFQTLLGKGTVSRPLQEETNLWTVYGELEEIRVLTPAGPLAVWQR